MSTFWTLYRYEMKKLVKRKLLFVTLLVCILCILFSVTDEWIVSYSTDGGTWADRDYRMALSGRSIDQSLLAETIAAYRRIPKTAEWYTKTEEYQTYARPYSDIFNLIRTWMGMDADAAMGWEPEEASLYAARASMLESYWKTMYLSDAEKAFWREKEAQIDTPMVYFYHEGYYVSLTDVFTIIGLLMLLFIAITMSGIFPNEHALKMDQLLRSSAKGKVTVYWAKILAGTSMAAAVSASAAALSVCLALAIYGAEGFQTALQISFPSYSYPLTMGQTCLIVYGILIVTSILMGVVSMVLSEVLHSTIAALAIQTGAIIAGGVLQIPSQYRAIAQLFNCLPTAFLSLWNIFDARLIRIFGHYLTVWQAVPAIYLLCGVIAVAVGKWVYVRQER